MLFAALGGCDDNSSDAVPAAPIVSGSPASSVVAGRPYVFSPTIHPPGAQFTFSVKNQPAWAAFDAATGKLSGTPQAANVGVYANIAIEALAGKRTIALTPFSITVEAAPAAGPAISGTPAKTVVVGANYSFQPTVTGAGDATLSFAISNAPAWAKFDPATGTLSGTPAAADVGTSAQILITVSGALGSAALAPFSIVVTSGSSAVATVTWTTPAPDAADDALAGYRVYYGTSVAGMTHVVTIDDPTTTSYVIDNLGPGTWYFAIASYDSDQTQSALSPTIAVNL
jgi:hypothetical protein